MHPSSLRLQTLFEQSSPDKLLPLYNLLEDKITGRCRTPQELAKELRLWGSNTGASILRGWEGVEYIEVVTDVAEKLNVDISKSGDERDFELAILVKILAEYLKNASPKEREEIKDILKQAGKDCQKVWSSLVIGSLDTVLLLVNTVGRKAVQTVIKKICTSILAQLVAKQVVTRATAVLVDLAIPFVNIILTAWLLVDIAGPAFRKTVPAVIQVALLRLDVEEPDSHCPQT